jgi:hypothetical protein
MAQDMRVQAVITMAKAVISTATAADAAAVIRNKRALSQNEKKLLRACAKQLLSVHKERGKRRRCEKNVDLRIFMQKGVDKAKEWRYYTNR